MVVPRQPDPRANQKKRTRNAIVEAALTLIGEGSLPSVAEAAERALVSRATAYRYFPTQDSLLIEVAQIEPLIAPVERLVEAFPSDDAAQRLVDLIQTFMPIMLGDEAFIRTLIRIQMDTWLENERVGQRMPLRSGRRMRWLEAALRPIQPRLTDQAWLRLRNALALILGTEAMVALKDVVGLESDDEILATLRWAAHALLCTSLEEARSGAG